MKDTDFEFVLRNYKKYVNIAAKENLKRSKRKTKILKVLSDIDNKLVFQS